jgi:hypothetical protein
VIYHLIGDSKELAKYVYDKFSKLAVNLNFNNLQAQSIYTLKQGNILQVSHTVLNQEIPDDILVQILT